MLKVRGVKKRNEVRLIKHFAIYALSRFLTPAQIRKNRITINYVTVDELTDKEDKKDLVKYAAWLWQDRDDGSYDIYVHKAAINKRALSPLAKYKTSLKYIAHELVHVKQYITGEMADIWHGENYFGTRWMGTDYPEITGRKLAANPIKAEWAYYDSPWELEAYGRSDGIFNMYHEEHGEQWLLTN